MTDCLRELYDYYRSMVSSKCTDSSDFLKITRSNQKKTACFLKLSHELLFSREFITHFTPVRWLIKTGLRPTFCPHYTKAHFTTLRPGPSPSQNLGQVSLGQVQVV